MATDNKVVVVPDTGGIRCMIKCPQCLGLQLLCVWLQSDNLKSLLRHTNSLESGE